VELFRLAVLGGNPGSLFLHSEESGGSHVAELGLGDGVAVARIWVSVSCACGC
jgi:hypothetical protein